MEDKEIHEIEVKLGGGETMGMNVTKSEDWSEIKPDSRAILSRVDGEMMLVRIQEADEDEGVSFKIGGHDQKYHYEAAVIADIFVEVEPIDGD